MADVASNREDQLGSGNIAAPWWYGDCSVIPIRADGTKSPMVSWKQYQESMADPSTVKNWFEERWPNCGVAVICGQVSGNLEMLELEGRANDEHTIRRIEAACIENGIGDLWQVLTTDGYTEMTPSGGLHLLYRVIGQSVPGNEKIASRPAHDNELNVEERQRKEANPDHTIIRVLAETRGEGGYVIVAPTGGHCHPSGFGWTTLTGTPGEFIVISWEQRKRLHEAVRSVLHVPVTQDLIPVKTVTVAIERDPNAPLTPVEDFNARASWNDAWFTEQGWRVHHQDGNEIFWTRPGKDWADGHSASTGVRDGGQDCLYVWSTSTGLPIEVPLTKFMVYAHYKFNNDRSAAAQFLRRTGWGTPVHPPLKELSDTDLQLKEGTPPTDLPPHSLEHLAYDFTGGVVLTDIGYANRINESYIDRLRYNAMAKTWHVWHAGSGCWESDWHMFVINAVKKETDNTYNHLRRIQKQNPIAAGELKPLVKQAQSAMNNNRVKAITEMLQSTPNMTIHPNEFDMNLDLLNLQNGTLNLNTFELKPHDPTDLITMTFNAAYDPDAECPNFVKYLNDVFPDEEVREYIQRAVGYSLLGKPRERALFILHGPSGTGKSVFTEVMTELFGTYGTSAPSSTFKLKTHDSSFDVHDLRGKRLVSASELPQKLEMNEELVKRLTGGDRIKSRGLYERFIEWDARCVIWIATNHLPNLTGDDDAMWRRVRTIPMWSIIKDQKEEIGGYSTILIQEANGLLNWALEGLTKYREKGLAEPSVIINDIAAYRNESDSVMSWLTTMLDEGTYCITPENRTSATVAHTDYETFCHENGTKPFGPRRFIKRMETAHKGMKVQRLGGRGWITGLGKIGGLTP